MSRAGDYIIWYSKDKQNIKYRQLYYQKTEYTSGYDKVKLLDGSTRAITPEEKNDLTKLPNGAKLYSSGALFSSGAGSNIHEFIFKEKKFKPPVGSHWKTSLSGLEELAKKGRIEISGNTLRYIRSYNYS